MEDQDITKSLSEYNDIFKEESKLYQDIARDMGLSQCSFWILYTIPVKDRIPTAAREL